MADIRCVSTPGHDVDVIVTPEAVAAHDARDAPHRRPIEAGLPVRPFEESAAQAAAEADPAPPTELRRVSVEARDGRVADWI